MGERITLTSRQKNQLADLYCNKGLTLKEIGKKMGMAASTIHYQVGKMDLKRGEPQKASRPTVWTPKRKKHLSDLYANPNLSFNEIVKATGLARSTVYSQATKMGLTRASSKEWRAEEDEVLKQSLASRGLDYCIAKLERPESTVRRRAQDIGLLEKTVQPSGWTPKEDEHLVKQRAEGVPYAQIAKELGRTQEASRYRHKVLRGVVSNKGDRERRAKAQAAMKKVAGPSDSGRPLYEIEMQDSSTGLINLVIYRVKMDTGTRSKIKSLYDVPFRQFFCQIKDWAASNDIESFSMNVIGHPGLMTFAKDEQGEFASTGFYHPSREHA